MAAQLASRLMDFEQIREPYERAFAVDPLATLKVLWAYRNDEIDAAEAVRRFWRIWGSAGNETKPH